MIPSRVGVIGGGRMGAGIAHAFLLAGVEVVVVERPDAIERATRAIELAVDRSIERGTTQRRRDGLLAALRVTSDLNEVAHRELVIEAVPEVPHLKAGTLAAVAALVRPDAVLATNTSALSIDELAAAVDHPERFLGLHFFNPVPASQLVEVVGGSATAPAIVAAAQRWVRALGKTPVTVADAPGFASSRLGIALALEAIRMLEDRVASADDIDAAMTLGYRHATGPLRTTDIVGLDVRLGIAEHLHERLGERFAPPQLLRDLVAAGKLGRKSGEGFFVWPTEGEQR